MREIKMKVYTSGGMIGPFDLSQHPMYWAHKLRDGERLLYTGLTDKNGVEIYEGDVIRFIIPERHSVIKGNGYEDIQTDKGFEVNGVVKFLHAMWFIEEVGGKGVPLDFDEEQITEVVGNIYENPELLEGDTK